MGASFKPETTGKKFFIWGVLWSALWAAALGSEAYKAIDVCGKLAVIYIPLTCFFISYFCYFIVKKVYLFFMPDVMVDTRESSAKARYFVLPGLVATVAATAGGLYGVLGILDLFGNAACKLYN